MLSVKTTLPILIFICLIINPGCENQQDPFEKNLGSFDQILSEFIPETGPGVAVIVTHNNQIIFEKYHGLANCDSGEKLKADHVMGIASMSKQFTGMAVLWLVQEGKLNLDDEITRYFPDLPLGSRIITIRQLLSHISGLPELTRNEFFMNHIADPHTVDQIIDMAFTGEFRSEPGEKYLYCNTGYTIVTALIEKLSGQPYAEFLEEKIFKPLGMQNTYACDFDHDAINVVRRHDRDSSGFKKAITMHFSNLIGGGSIVSNAWDMAKWGIALSTGTKLPANYELIWKSAKLNTGEEFGYGLGLGNNEFNGKKYHYHPGQGSGMDAINMIFPDDQISITVIQNLSPPNHSSGEIALRAAEYLFQAE